MPWQLLANHSQILAVHAAYMGFGQILYFGGDEHDPRHSETGQFDATRLFDCGSTTVKSLPSPDFDSFCTGHAFLGASNVVKFLVAGGTEQFIEHAEGLHHPHFPGLRDSAIFSSPDFVNPSGGGWTWQAASPMNTGLTAPPSEVPHPDPERTGGRWYPTLMTLANGEVIAFSGHPGSSDRFHSNDIPEVFSRNPEPHGEWRRLAQYSNSEARDYYQLTPMPLYPRVHLLPSGDILCANPLPRRTVTFMPGVGPHGGSFTQVCIFPPGEENNYGEYKSTSVLLPLSHRENFRARVMVCGGASRTPYVLDLQGWHPSQASAASWRWLKTAPRQIGERRIHASATILPTGEILVNGGIDVGIADVTLDSKAVFKPELYDPYANKWTVLDDPASSVRNYHSVALLMPDGRVWTAGSDEDGAPGAAARNLDIEIFEPWYHGDPDRPYVTAAPSLARPGETIYVESTFADQIERVVLVRCGSSTHAFNSDQRLIDLEFRHVTGDVLLVEMPPTNFITPPGPYLIYTLRQKPGTLGLPSTGTDIYIVPERKRDQGPPDGDH